MIPVARKPPKTRSPRNPNRPSRAAVSALILTLGLATALLLATILPAQTPAPEANQGPLISDPQQLFETYCTSCHNSQLRTAGLALDNIDLANPGAHADVLENVVSKLRSASMPPAGMPRPNGPSYRAVASALENSLDQAWAANPNPGRIGSVHRLNRTEYSNAIRDLFDIDIDVTELLPADGTADGSFDNFADVLTISTAHLERYMSVARQVTRIATGLPPAAPGVETFEMPKLVLQDYRMSENLPFGSRGGMAIDYNFPVDGEYLIRVRLQRQYQDYLKGMGWEQQLEIRLDDKLLDRFPVGGQGKGRPAAASYAGDGEPGFAGDPAWETYMQLTGDDGLEVRIPVAAGPHTVGVSFLRELWEPEGLPQPIQLGRVISNDQVYMGYANVGTVDIGGPYEVQGPAKDTPSRRAIFTCYPSAPAEEESCAVTILARMARLAYRRPVTKADTDTLMDFFRTGRADGGSFDSGIQFSLERLLVDPDFLLRVYREPSGGAALRPSTPFRNVAETAAPTETYKLSDLDLASRLSFFLWSSIPDERLLGLAESNQLSQPETLAAETRRMLADPRAVDAITNDFAAQWLNLRQVVDVVIDPNFYPTYDESLLRGFQTETAMFIAHNVRQDRPVSELLNADYTFINERLAQNYGIPGVYGNRFRQVTVPDPAQRGGILAHGSILVNTSYPDRTSPVLRGKWLLNNIFGLTIPPPPPTVETALESAPGTAPKTMRERLDQHRVDPTCNSCHIVIDPLGFALENYDVIGAWRTHDEASQPIDASGTTATGEPIDGLPGLRNILLSQPDQFPHTVAEKLMAYALGRRVEYYDQPSIRKIVRDAAPDYRWSSIVTGIVQSPAFLMRATEAPTEPPSGIAALVKNRSQQSGAGPRPAADSQSAKLDPGSQPQGNRATAVSN